MKNLLNALLVSGVLGGVCLADESAGGPFTLIAFTIDGGGGTSSGGTFSLTGAAGQPDTGTLQGGTFTLQGGFYSVVAATTGGDATLTIALDNDGNAILTWNVDGFTLEFRDSLDAGPAWQAVSPAPTGRTYVTPANLPTRYFRLLRP